MAPFDLEWMQPLTEAARNPNSAATPCRACRVRHMTVCGSLAENELADLAALSQGLELESGAPLFDEGEPAAHVFNVVEGTLKIYKLLPDGRRQMVGFLFAGDFLGLANNDNYAYSAEAVTHAAVCRFPRARFEALLDRYPKLQTSLFNVANHELAVAQEQMMLLGRKTAKEKIASFLLTLSERAEVRGASANPVCVPMSRADIGDYLGLTTETVSRTFTQLRGKELIALHNGGQVALRDPAALQRLSQGL